MYTLISICHERSGSQEYHDNNSLNDLLIHVCYGMYDNLPKFNFKCRLNHIVINDNDVMEYVITGVSYKDLKNIKSIITDHFKDIF